MGIMNDVKGGADLTHPRASSGWIIGATVAVVMLLVAVGIATYLYRTGKKAIGGGVTLAGEQTGMSGIFGDGT